MEEYDSLLTGLTQSLEFCLPEFAGAKFVARLWCDLLLPVRAQVIATYSHDDYAGKPAITRNVFGSGQVFYVGTFGDADLYQSLFGWLTSQIGLRRVMESPDGVEVTERWKGDTRLLFILNHTASSQTVTVPDGCSNLLNGSPVHASVTVAARDVLILISEN